MDKQKPKPNPKHVSYSKLQKKKQRELNNLKRGTWFGVNPVTRRPESSKAYNRRKAQDWKKDSGLALFLYGLQQQLSHAHIIFTIINSNRCLSSI